MALPYLTDVPLFVLLLAGFGVVSLMLALALRGLSGAEARTPLAPKALLTPNEAEFMRRLTSALPGYRVLAQVSMGALLKPGRGVPRHEHARVRFRFAQKIVDFVVLDAQLKVVALIELDDKSHSPAKDAARDAMTRAAGYTTLRYLSRAKPSEATIHADIQAVASMRPRRG